MESMARTPSNSIRQGSFTPHILGCLQHRKRDAKYPFERKSASKNSIFEGIRPIFQSLMGLKYAEYFAFKVFSFQIVSGVNSTYS